MNAGKVHNNNMWFHADKLRRPKQCSCKRTGQSLLGLLERYTRTRSNENYGGNTGDV